MYKYDDGGKSETTLKGASDCGIRAVAIACEISYMDARHLLKEFSNKGKLGSRAISNGIYKEDMEATLSSLGWSWRSAPKFEGRKARYYDMPRGRVIVRMAKHYAAVIDGNLHDAWDSSQKMVYGYWSK
jgi:hypothetical protein